MAVLQSSLSQEQSLRASAALPGVAPVGDRNWITVDSAYAGQIAEKQRLIAARRDDVLAQCKGAPVDEALQTILTTLDQHPDFQCFDDTVRCPDNRHVTLNFDDPLGTAAQLVQEDICLLEKKGDEHVLTAALLCFPAGWTLAEKIGRPLMQIHDPVSEYDMQVGKRVQRLFDGVQVGRPLWRANQLSYADPGLYAPHKRTCKNADGSYFTRSERQTILRLPTSGAVIFAIHTTVVAA